jgi:cytochrome c biogenesis protein CcmG, thiol:disulfide interchange protein DsbE
MRRVLSPVSIAVLGAVGALVALLVYGVVQSEPDRRFDDALARGERERAPALELPALDGRGLGGLADYRGQVVVLNFWASWCEPCRKESPLLERWYRRASGREATVLGVDALDVTADAREFIGEHGLSYPMLKDRDGDAMASYGVAQLPETFVIDRAGRIAAIRRGPVDEQFMEAEVEPLLEGT